MGVGAEGVSVFVGDFVGADGECGALALGDFDGVVESDVHVADGLELFEIGVVDAGGLVLSGVGNFFCDEALGGVVESPIGAFEGAPDAEDARVEGGV